MTILYLASKSPRRRELLQQLGITPTLLLPPPVPGDDEPRLPGEAPADYVRRTARDKAERAAQAMRDQALPVHPILAADTTVSLGDEILGKPADRADACRILQALSGTCHEVRTAVALIAGEQLHEATCLTYVHFRALSARDIARYCDTDEPYDKAGAYGIQGLAGVFVSRIDGSHTGVMGLPLFETAGLLAHAGMHLP